jgi:hypothetical protein
MEKIIHTGGPAFPAPAGVSHITEQGMTLRDYFAAKSMPIAWEAYDKGYMLIVDENVVASVAKAAYEQADAMLKARKS